MMYPYPYFRPPFFAPMYRKARYFQPSNLSMPSDSISKDNRQLSKSNVSNKNLQAGYLNESTYINSTTLPKTNCNINSTLSSSSKVYQEVSPSSKVVEQKENRSYDDKPIFEIFGISLYFDDLLLLGLLFFLYSEGVQDKELFLALILLLLS